MQVKPAVQAGAWPRTLAWPAQSYRHEGLKTVFHLAIWPFIGVFFICFLAQFPVFGGLRDALRKRHPEVWETIEISPLLRSPMFARELAFILSGSYRELRDPDLTRRVMCARWLGVVGVVAWGGLVVGLFTVSR